MNLERMCIPFVKSLTPKGLNVRTADKPVLVCVTWAHTIFWFFETFFEHASHSKLRGKEKNAFFGPTDQKLWMFEVSSRSLGRAGMCCSQWERVDHLHKKWGAGRKKMNFWKFGKWARAFGRMGVQHPHFWSLPLHLEVLILPKFMESGDFTIFHNLFIF
jgi:hypothetical protein